MARYDQLFVYKSCYLLLISLYKELSRIPRDIKYTVLQEMKHDSLDVLRQIYHANSTQDKIPYLDSALDKIFDVKINTRVLWDLKAVDNTTYGRLAEQAESVSKQLTAWKKSIEKQEHDNLQQ